MSGDDDQRSSDHELAQGLAHSVDAGRVEAGGDLVSKEHRGTAESCACERDTLTLTTGQVLRPSCRQVF